jgi:hypothetical protein
VKPTVSEATITHIKYGDRILRDMSCAICKRAVEERGGFAPYHDASERCESGKRAHCSCSTCF